MLVLVGMAMKESPQSEIILKRFGSADQADLDARLTQMNEVDCNKPMLMGPTNRLDVRGSCHGFKSAMKNITGGDLMATLLDRSSSGSLSV